MNPTPILNNYADAVNIPSFVKLPQECVLFDAHAPVTEPVLKKFYNFCYSNRLSTRIFTIICSVLAGIILLLTLATGNFGSGLTPTIIFMVLIIVLPRNMGSTRAQIKLSAPKNFNDAERFLFYQDFFYCINSSSVTKMPYADIINAYEVKDAFYLFYTPQRAFIVQKNGFVYNTPSELSKMLYIKLGNKFTVKNKG